MFSKLKKNKYHIFVVLIFLLSLFIPFLSIPNFKQYFYLASGDFLPPLSKENIFFNNLFIYKPFIYGGSDTGYTIAKLFPESALYYTLSFLGLKISTITLIYISLIILLSEISTYYFLLYVLSNKFGINSNRKYFFAVIGSILYTFSPYFVSTVIPGHFPQLIVYSSLPLLLLLFDKNINKSRVDFKLFIKYFIIFLFSASVFSNVAFIYVVILTFCFFSLLKIILEKISLINIINNFFALIFALILSNIFWILSFINSLGQLINLSSETLESLDSQVYLAATKSNILNILLGRSEWQLYLLKTNYYINSIYLFIFILISIIFIISIFNYYKNKFVATSLWMTLFAIFICKGPQKPFGSIFMWFYHNLFGFQVFRRPISKYHGIFLLFYFTISIIGLTLMTIKLSRKKFFLFVLLPICSISIYLVFIFVKTFQLIPFNIPDYYFQAKKYLIKQNVKKVLILPGLQGLQPSYNASINNLYATDFLYSLWPFPFDSPVGADFATEYNKNIINPIMNRVRAKKDICDLTKKAGISHIMIRQDLSFNNPFEDQPKDLFKLMSSLSIITEKKEFYNDISKGFTIYRIDKNCIENLVTLTENNNANINYQIINPTKIKISINNIKNVNNLVFLNNFRHLWKLYLSKYKANFLIQDSPLNTNTYPNKKIFFEGEELTYLTKKSLFDESHSTIYNWANKWKIDPQYILNNYSQDYYSINPDGSLNIQIILYYQTQSLFYLGIIVFIFVCIFITILYFFYNGKSNH